ncbi:MAG: GntR family transcriptional regulator [Microcella sp.]|uniref:GntR family transcriptional regulator n=1 Tax=Microcella sp. TaxID=1913979 RepID=UPI003315C98A
MIYEKIAAQIASGELAPGQRIIEPDVAAQFGVSLAPVREAFRQLGHAGMVLKMPRRGTFVATIDEAGARRAYLVRAALERVAAQEFCSHADEHDVRTLRQILDDMVDAANVDDLSRFIERDIEFHRAVWVASKNDLLGRMWPLVEVSMRGLTLISNRLFFGSLQEIAATHEPLYRALVERDAAEAAELFERHTAEVWERIDSDEGRALE